MLSPPLLVSRPNLFLFALASFPRPSSPRKLYIEPSSVVSVPYANHSRSRPPGNRILLLICWEYPAPEKTGSTHLHCCAAEVWPLPILSWRKMAASVRTRPREAPRAPTRKSGRCPAARRNTTSSASRRSTGNSTFASFQVRRKCHRRRGCAMHQTHPDNSLLGPLLSLLRHPLQHRLGADHERQRAP